MRSREARQPEAREWDTRSRTPFGAPMIASAGRAGARRRARVAAAVVQLASLDRSDRSGRVREDAQDSAVSAAPGSASALRARAGVSLT